MAAVVLALLWLAGSAAWLLWRGPAAAGSGALPPGASALITILLPVALLGLGVATARALRTLRAEITELRAALDTARAAARAQNHALAATVDRAVAQKLDALIAAEASKAGTPPPPPAPRPDERAPQHHARPAPPPSPAPGAQAALPLGPLMADRPLPLAHSDLIRALNFPESPEDKAGFDALRRALRDRPAAQLIRAAQDVLTLMSEDGIYMDDLRPDMARPEIWRRFAAGERGRAIAALGGIRDAAPLASMAARMKQDTIFRDAAHHFLRLFDRMFPRFAETASDAEIAALSDTRTARAFMLLGRVAGTFD